jgi:hypothetical protein
MLVTNQLQYARPADRILYMAEGRVVEAGTYDELMERGGGFAQLMQQTEVRAAQGLGCLQCGAAVQYRRSPRVHVCQGSAGTSAQGSRVLAPPVVARTVNAETDGHCRSPSPPPVAHSIAQLTHRMSVAPASMHAHAVPCAGHSLCV